MICAFLRTIYRPTQNAYFFHRVCSFICINVSTEFPLKTLWLNSILYQKLTTMKWHRTITACCNYVRNYILGVFFYVMLPKGSSPSMCNIKTVYFNYIHQHSLPSYTDQVRSYILYHKLIRIGEMSCKTVGTGRKSDGS